MTDDLARAIYHVLDPRPLRANETDLYVDLDDVRGSAGIAQRLANKIRLSNRPTCQVVAGHRGSGKSTELRRVQYDLQSGDPRIFVVYCEADEDIDRNDVDFPEVLIAVVKQMAGQLKPVGVELKPGYFKDRFDRLKHLLTSEIDLDKVGIETALVSLSATIKSSPDARIEIRKLLEPDTSNWLYAANDLIGKAKLELGKKGYGDLVIMVDDLDKMVHRPLPEGGCCTSEHLFVHREAQLTAFDCHMVYTMPIALAYSGQERVIANLYGGNVPVIPMTKVATCPPEARPHEAGIQKFRDLISCRLMKAGAAERDLFESDALRDEVIRLSGGQPREMLLLMREAMVGGGIPIKPAALKRVVDEHRRAYARQLRAEHLPVIESVRASGTIERTKDNEQAVRELLDSRAILQYVNDEEWYGLNPLLPPPRPQ